MRVLQVNNCDLPGRIFNGYDLNIALNKHNIEARQVVMNKYSDDCTVIQLEYDSAQREKIKYLEGKYSVSNVLFPYAKQLMKMDEYRIADIVHFHFPYHNMFSLFDYNDIFTARSVWTIHDPWVISGNCTYPMDCESWRTGCKGCSRYDDIFFPMKENNVEFMWNVKKEMYRDINPHIVVSCSFMENYIKNSPLTGHFTKIHTIPFGIEVKDVHKAKNKKIIIGFRAEQADVKGCKYLYEALNLLKDLKEYIEIQCVGAGVLPSELMTNFEVKSYGWINDREKLLGIIETWDIFVMPSLAESFGLMAIEAMGCKCALVCFDNTAVSCITKAPYYSVAANYADSEDLYYKLRDLIEDKSKRERYQNEGYEFVRERYRFSEYVKNHIELYEQIMDENNG